MQLHRDGQLGPAAAGRQGGTSSGQQHPPQGTAGTRYDSSSRRQQQRLQRPLLPAAAARLHGDQQQQQQQVRAELHTIHSLALTAAAAALHPERRRVLDHRALVMVAHNLAKMQLQDSSITQQLLQALGPGVLPQLDPQQLTNLIWAVGVSSSNAQGDSSSPYRLLLVPAALRRSGPVVPVIATAAALVDSRSSTGSSQVPGGEPPVWEQVPAVAEPAAADRSCDELQAAANIDTFADAMAVASPAGSSAAGGSNNACQPQEEWLAAAAEALLQQLPSCSSQGVSMALWGFAQLGCSPPEAWWEGFWPGTQDSLQRYSAQDLALLMCAVGKLGPQVPAGWLSSYCSAACDVMPAMSSQQLTMCLWGLACAGATPHKAFVLLWFLSSIGLMGQATTQELSMWLYALALLRITPSPSWCSAFVEASFGSFTAPHTRPQDLVTAMWSISRLGWSPPLLYWRGLMEAASRSFSLFGPQDLANCVSAASAVDIGCISDAWLSAFIKASQARLSAFEPVQLAHTANALAVIAKPHPSAYRIIHAAWQAAFVDAARHHLAAGRFSLRNLVLVVTSLRVLRFKQAGEVQQFLGDAETALAGMWAQEQQRLVLDEMRADQLAQP